VFLILRIHLTDFAAVSVCVHNVNEAIGEVWFFGWGANTYGERGARTYNGGLGAVPPAGSRGRAPGGGAGQGGES